MHFTDIVSLREALFDARRDTVTHRATSVIYLTGGTSKIFVSRPSTSLIHDVNPSQLSGASHRSSEEKHYWMRGATR